MVTQKISVLCCILCLTTSVLLAQTVEKFSASFTFPLTLTAVPGKVVAPAAMSFFHVGPKAQKGKILLQWTVSGSVPSGSICIYSLSGALVKKVTLTSNHGTIYCDLQKASPGIYLASISYGTFQQNQKFALYR
ncbi:MAG TPA: T9SS type A sorting domain-containing protein [Chitinivibrionales bacterium]|nr:T9SS type A sorting domain-containing protein [Chitinivibrionales bacterium]